MSLLNKSKPKTESSKPTGNIEALDNLREKTEDKQKNMLQEDFDKKKLKPVLEEAYKLVKLIEEKTGSKEAIRAKLEKQKQKLIDQQKKL